MVSFGLAAVLAFVQIPAPRDSGNQAALRQEAAAIRQKETAQLEALAAQLRKDGKKSEAEDVETCIDPEPPPSGAMRFVPLEEVASPPPKEFPELKKIRTATARALYQLALRAGSPEGDSYALADACLRGVIERDWNHAEARRLLGYVRYGNGGWATPEAARNLKDKKVLDPIFGWVPADWVPHLEKGELPGPTTSGRPVSWLLAQEADALRAQSWDKERAWQIQTEHFFIRTNVPLNEAIAFGRRLEDLHDAFFAVLGDLLGPNLPLAQRMRSPKLWATVSRKKHEVWYFASKDEYIQFFQARFGKDEKQSLGYYMPVEEAKSFREPPRSYFYRDPNNPISVYETLFHEASHQLLFESGVATNFKVNRGNFWVWEGLGTFFETFVPQDDGSYNLGGIVGARMAKARDDIVFRKQLVPTSELVVMSRAQFLEEPGVFQNYSEAMALAVFLMQYDNGRYRDRFLDYISSAYRGNLRSDTSGKALSERLQVPYKQLDSELTEFLAAGAKAQAGN